MRRHLLSLRELDADQILHLLALAEHCERDAPADALVGRTAVTLFYEPSTRTEISFELAAKRLGAEVVRCDVDRSSVKKGERFVDTVQTLEALGADVMVIRHPSAGAAQLASRWVRSAIVNAGDGMHEHPTQGLLDLLTVRRRKGRIAGLRVAIVGDILHSRVARSALWGFTKLGAAVTLVGPPTLLPRFPSYSHGSSSDQVDLVDQVDAVDQHRRPISATMTSSLEEGLQGADVVIALRMQLERQQHGHVPSLAEYAQMYAITPRTLALARPDALLMHPGPMNLGVELSADAAYGLQSTVHQQVSNGAAVRMAVLLWCLGLDRDEERKPPRSQDSLGAERGNAEARKRETAPVIASGSEPIPDSTALRASR